MSKCKTCGHSPCGSCCVVCGKLVRVSEWLACPTPCCSTECWTELEVREGGPSMEAMRAEIKAAWDKWTFG